MWLWFMCRDHRKRAAYGLCEAPMCRQHEKHNSSDSDDDDGGGGIKIANTKQYCALNAPNKKKKGRLKYDLYGNLYLHKLEEQNHKEEH